MFLCEGARPAHVVHAVAVQVQVELIAAVLHPVLLVAVQTVRALIDFGAPFTLQEIKRGLIIEHRIN